MKKMLTGYIVAAWVVVAIGIGSLIRTGIVNASERQRFEHIYTSTWVEATDTRQASDMQFLVYHDKDSGNEIICAQQGAAAALSCFQSGRNWK